MEVFFDGGLFEILIAVCFAGLMNFIYLRKYLLVIFSIITISIPGILFFIHGTEVYYWLVSICLMNAMLLVCLLWKGKVLKPNDPLFKVENLKNKGQKILSRVRYLLFNSISK